ncbi:glycosyltransferase family 4 protein [Alicyclobacillus ferrooxydans]|uniref:Glycosyl transferase family 1 domain-containing protein n=1 Tax=Alicyclobacillus ferrooxydans TaxID=471514 RepID=A0A0P9EI16_9BACL|nr:glycosyltransferase family 1 protein [Alicyclobacillus ferrooxydans]KPV42382.1 hypothetical protein AN477_17360 [Alicyclobacillus ferrooxydans]
MRVGVDMHFAQSAMANAGIGRYALDHLAHLKEQGGIELLLFQPVFEGMTRTQYVDALSRFIIDNQLDIFHIPSPMSVPYPDVIGSSEISPVRLTASVYDLIPIIYPEVYLPSPEYRARYEAHTQMLRRMDGMLAISDHSHQDLLRFGYPAEKITTIGTGASDLFFPMPDAHLDDFVGVFPTDRQYVLAFSPLDFRKNIRRTVQAFAMATRNQPRDFQLVIVGDAPAELRQELQNIAAQHGRAGAVHFTGRISTAQLLRLFNRAFAIAFPSLYEGWGLPVLEALQCGTPVLTSNTTSLPEAAGNAAVYVNPEDVHSIADGFTHLLFVPGARDALAAETLAVAARHQWSEVAQKTMQVFESLMAMPIPERRAHVVGKQGQIVLHPNRYRLVRPGRGKLPRTYVSFNLQEVPDHMRIVRAEMHFAMRSGTRKPLVRSVTEGWSVDSAGRKFPLTRFLKGGGLGRIVRAAAGPGSAGLGSAGAGNVAGAAVFVGLAEVAGVAGAAVAQGAGGAVDGVAVGTSFGGRTGVFVGLARVAANRRRHRGAGARRILRRGRRLAQGSPRAKSSGSIANGRRLAATKGQRIARAQVRGSAPNKIRGLAANKGRRAIVNSRKLAANKSRRVQGGQRAQQRKGSFSNEAVMQWPCTILARRWRRLPLQNHGVMVRRALTRVPVLIVTYEYTTTEYR